MTTKNHELEFDIQAFAKDLSDVAVTLQANSGTISVVGATEEETTSEKGTIVAAGEGADYAAYRTDTTITSANVYTFDTENAGAPTSAARISSGTNQTVTTAWIGINDNNTPDDPSDDKETTITTTSDTTLAANTTSSSPLWLTGGGIKDSLVIANSKDSLSLANNNSYLGLTATNNNINYSSLRGDMSVSLSSASFKSTINGATINATLDSTNNANKVVSLSGAEEDNSNVTISADGNTNLSSIDTKQIWKVGSTNTQGVTYNRVSVTGDSGVNVTGIDDAGTFLSVNVDGDKKASFGTTGSGSRDTIGVNGTTLYSAAARAATVSVGADDNASLMTATIGSNHAGTISANGAVGGTANVAAGAHITIAGSANSVAAITAVDKLNQRGVWTLGNAINSATLDSDTVTFASAGTGNVITADSGGTKVASLSGVATLAGVGDHTVSVGGAPWAFDVTADTDSFVGAFDSLGNATVSAEETALSVSGSNNNIAGKTLAVGANGAADTLTMAAKGIVNISSDGVVSSATAIADESEWLVRGGSGERAVTAGASTTTIGFAFEKADSSSVYGALGKSTVDNGSGVINSIDSLSGNVTVAHGADSLGMNVMGTEWTVSKEANKQIIFDSTGGAASVAATSTSDLSVTAASTSASLTITEMPATISGGTHTVGGNFNGATVIAHDGDGVLGLQLESDTAAAGISGITSLNSGATVIGDNQFSVNGTFNVYKAANEVSSANTRFSLGGSSSITVQNVSSGDNYSVTGASNNTVVYAMNSIASAGSARVSLNAAQVTINAASAATDAYIVGAGTGDDVVRIGGVKANDTILSANDKKFTVVFDTSDITGTDTAVLAVNDAKVSLVADNLTTSGKSSISMAVDNSGSIPYITIASGIGTLTTVTVGAGVYNVGQSAQVTINDSTGYLYVDESGNVTGEDSLVADIREQRENALQSVVSGVDTPTIGAFYEFENIFYGQNSVFSGWNHTVASYADATVSSRSSINSSTGVNIYGDNSLGSYPNSVTLQSFLATPINIEHIEGSVSAATLNNAVIDVSNSNNTLVAIGANTAYPAFATNHTILGGSRQSTLMIGQRATGNNVVRAGNGGNYIYNSGGTASIFGGSGSDTIYAKTGDHVEGGDGIDYFYDASAVEISDYAFDSGVGDVIVATKLSTSANINPANLYLFGNQLAVAGGATLTVGSSENYDEATATRAIITNAAGSNRTNLIWAGNYDSSLDASDLLKGALMISSINGGAVNTITGSAYVDTIYAGANDLIDSGAGNDIINLAKADSLSGQRGATVVLSAGKNDVYGWVGGFDNEAGANILQATAANTSFKTKSGTVVAATDGASINFGDLSVDTTGAYNFLVGGEKVSFIGSEATVSVNSSSDIANYYKAEKAGGLYVGSGVDEGFGVTLGSDNFTNITKVNLQNESRASIIGSSANESITLGGTADAGASKSVASGAGNDLIVSGGDDTSKAGNYLFFGNYNGVTFSEGRDTVQNFSFYRGKDADPDMSASDVLNLGDSSKYGGLSATATRVEISLGDSTKVILSDNFSTYDNKIVRTRFSNTDEVFNCKFGLSNSVNTFTYDGETNAFFGSESRYNDTLKVAADLTNVNIWLKDRNFDQNYYYGIRTIDASALTETRATLVGDSLTSNVINSAGAGSASSLWGGGGESNVLIGGEGDDTFFYFKNYGYTDSDGVRHASNDVIMNANSEDLVWLYDITLNDINANTTSEGIVSNRVTVGLNDGSTLSVATSSSSVNFRLSDGQGGWTDVRATGGSNHGWE